MPKRVKFRKQQRGTRRGISTRGSTLQFGEYGLKALDNAWLTNHQIEACRVALARQLRKGGKFWIRVFPDHSVTKKPAETRMGKGKGELDHWICVVKRGKILFEMGGVPLEYARRCFNTIIYKIPFKTKFVTRI